jgi:MFS family permease
MFPILLKSDSLNRSIRATCFSYVNAIIYATGLFSPSIAAFLMTSNLWLPFWIAISLLLAALPVLFLLPLSEGRPRPTGGITTEEQPLMRQNPEDIKLSRFETLWRSYITSTTSVLPKLWSQLGGRSNFRLLVTVFFVASVASCNTPILPQYISKRYGWTFAEAGYLLSIKAAINIVLLTIVIPTIIKIFHRRSTFNSVTMSRNGAKISLILSVIAAVCVAISFQTWMLISCMFDFSPPQSPLY